MMHARSNSPSAIIRVIRGQKSSRGDKILMVCSAEMALRQESYPATADFLGTCVRANAFLLCWSLRFLPAFVSYFDRLPYRLIAAEGPAHPGADARLAN